ncbi:patatin-like phospholipase family protein [Methylobacterium planeticum]|uniref:NTE family protein rssA n=1 Tax=Methylobacterium planeticum TaxID=2615211 RepID=A0A6N6MUC3_9HYPH|nr:patatin-like phospholipase family protein [Methylobacterium planeticum]KAB1074206.1 NTE family protein rssA [Methylobacterium planeticum]
MSWDGAPFREAALHRSGPVPAFVVPGAVEPVRAPRPRGPRIGLALGGGSARGWSHIGVIRALEEAGIHPEVVAGCSIGAVVGGCYAAGKLDVLAEFALSLTKRRVMGLLDVRLSGSGLIGGDRLRQRLEGDLEDRRIEGLPVRFASVATELGTGHEVWLTRGGLVEAVRASYALPGIFPPLALDGRLLMDGTLVNPVPVSLARALGADLVICVNLNCDPRVRGGTVIAPAEAGGEADAVAGAVAGAVEVRRRWSLLGRMRGAGRRLAGRPAAALPARGPAGAPGIARVMFDAFNITQDRISRARLERDPPDVSVNPRLAEMGLFEFHRAAEAIALGHQAARAALPRIRAALEGASART